MNLLLFYCLFYSIPFAKGINNTLLHCVMPPKIMLNWMNIYELSISEIDLLMYVRCRTKYLHDTENITKYTTSLEKNVTIANITKSEKDTYIILNSLLGNLVSLENISKIIKTNYSDKNIFLNDSVLKCSKQMPCFAKNSSCINDVSFSKKNKYSLNPI